MSDRFDGLIDERTLRRSLRLESDERPPRFDPAAIASAARLRPRSVLATGLVALAIGATGAVAVWAWVSAASTLAARAFEGAIALAVALALPVTAILQLVQQPVVPLSLVAALTIAIVYELRERELAHAPAS